MVKYSTNARKTKITETHATHFANTFVCYIMEKHSVFSFSGCGGFILTRL